MASLLPFKQCTSPLLRAQAYHHPALFSACSTSRAAHVRPARATADDKDSNPFLGASGQASASPSTSTSTKTSSDVRVESLEKAIRGGKRSNSGSNAAPRRQIPIRGVNQPKVEQVSEEFAPWKEGQLFPEGWDNMPLSQKLSELYMGQRGVLFWANKAAYAAAIGMLVGWVFFRFVGPNLGLYQLAGDLVVPQI